MRGQHCRVVAAGRQRKVELGGKVLKLYSCFVIVTVERKNEKKCNQLSLVCHSLNAESGGFLNEILQLVASKLILVCLFVTSWEEQTRGGETDENIGESITDFTSLNPIHFVHNVHNRG